MPMSAPDEPGTFVPAELGVATGDGRARRGTSTVVHRSPLGGTGPVERGDVVVVRPRGAERDRDRVPRGELTGAGVALARAEHGPSDGGGRRVDLDPGGGRHVALGEQERLRPRVVV